MPFPHAVIGKPKTPHSLSLFWAHLLLLKRRMLYTYTDVSRDVVTACFVGVL